MNPVLSVEFVTTQSVVFKTEKIVKPKRRKRSQSVLKAQDSATPDQLPIDIELLYCQRLERMLQ